MLLAWQLYIRVACISTMFAIRPSNLHWCPRALLELHIPTHPRGAIGGAGDPAHVTCRLA